MVTRLVWIMHNLIEIKIIVKEQPPFLVRAGLLVGSRLDVTVTTPATLETVALTTVTPMPSASTLSSMTGPMCL